MNKKDLGYILAENICSDIKRSFVEFCEKECDEELRGAEVMSAVVSGTLNAVCDIFHKGGLKMSEAQIAKSMSESYNVVSKWRTDECNLSSDDVHKRVDALMRLEKCIISTITDWANGKDEKEGYVVRIHVDKDFIIYNTTLNAWKTLLRAKEVKVGIVKNSLFVIAEIYE